MRRNIILIIVSLLTLGALFHNTYQYAFYWFLGILGVFGFLGLYDMLQVKNSILRNYPLVGHFRYIMKEIAPEIHQYFVEDNTDGKPFNKNEIDLINSRANLKNENHPFGTEMDIYKDGHEWVSHSQFPTIASKISPRVLIGSDSCQKPYSSSLLNISGMSYGSLSSNAIMALNKGAALGHFSHNTGEGAISKYHLKHGGDIIWQIGTGYFGCRTSDGQFDADTFAEKASAEAVKMIEIKLSQGAKPGHGGILPAIKNTPKIAEVRGIEPHTTIHSPPYHSAFKNSEELLHFIQTLRELSGGKPVGIKMCIGSKKEFYDMSKQMSIQGICPDFICIDGSEGGTGAAPLEFSNHIGMPGHEAIAYVHDVLNGFNIRGQIKVVYSGKVVSGFDIVRAIAVGADLCNAARAMMFAIGCIQSLRCHNNSCPTGIATQNRHLAKGLHVEHKSSRVYNYHKNTIKSAVEIVAAMGLTDFDQLGRDAIYQWSGENNRSMQMSEIFPEVEKGAYL